eukprot:4489558-Pleurochrysis_carterae.AAC.1
MGLTVGQTAVDDRDLYRHPGQRLSGSEPPSVPLPRRPSCPSIVDPAQHAPPPESQPQVPNVQ